MTSTIPEPTADDEGGARQRLRGLHDPVLTALSDRGYRVHTNALVWSIREGTDGRIPRGVIASLHPEGASDDDARALVRAGLWDEVEDGWHVRDWASWESTARAIQPRGVAAIVQWNGGVKSRYAVLGDALAAMARSRVPATLTLATEVE